MPAKFKPGDVVVRLQTNVHYPILKIQNLYYIIKLPNGYSHYIMRKTVDKDCRLVTKLEKALK